MHTAKAIQAESENSCFEYIFASQKYRMNSSQILEAQTPEECQAHCRRTFGCQLFQWFPNQCYLKDRVPEWNRYEWHTLPNAIAGPSVCSSKLLLNYLSCYWYFIKAFLPSIEVKIKCKFQWVAGQKVILVASLQKRSSMTYLRRKNVNFNVKIMEIAFISNLTKDLTLVSFMERKE